MPEKPPVGPTPVESIKHKDTRKNIPTEELRDFVAADEWSRLRAKIGRMTWPVRTAAYAEPCSA